MVADTAWKTGVLLISNVQPTRTVSLIANVTTTVTTVSVTPATTRMATSAFRTVQLAHTARNWTVVDTASTNGVTPISTVQPTPTVSLIVNATTTVTTVIAMPVIARMVISAFHHVPRVRNWTVVATASRIGVMTISTAPVAWNANLIGFATTG